MTGAQKGVKFRAARRRLRRRLELADAQRVKVFGPEPRAFLGAGHIVAGELISTRLLSPTEVQGLLTARTT